MNMTSTDETILKTDVLGRVKTPAARREQLLDEFERSGLTGQKFAELVGLKYQTFATWAQKRRRQRGAYEAVGAPARTTDKVRWLEAVVEQAQN
ncbi:MAG: IS66 family insertion sequence element accessory protein TnpA [Terriglobia bacterium]